MLIFEGKEIEKDTEGYLKESSQWSEPLAVVIAENEGISLSPEHWEVVACGEEGQVEKLMQWLKSGGPRSARVERVLNEPHHPSGELTDFRIR